MNFIQSVDADYYILQNVKLNVSKSGTSSCSNNKQICLDHQCLKKVQERHNQAMIEETSLPDTKEISKGYVAYPAKLLVKVDSNQEHHFLQKEF